MMNPVQPDVEELLITALQDTVRTEHEGPGQALVAELERRGTEALWEAAQLCLGLLASRPVYGLVGQNGTEHLRRVARTADPPTACTLNLLATHRDRGHQAARPIWDQATPAVRTATLHQLLITVASSIGSDGARLSARQTARLIRTAIPSSSSWQ
ncbi:hypothetical protein LN042_35090 [Kitasatospora sp. RB6PN24]|uniref:hypothetical protein n=1 Tax=Kitasatospora humi TaxID=2893891 RepID=UPI001E4EFF02|nr:hypothetical protein [Kitasatospora humi]MCC9312229.1 hypothetical protein [Kitasatospora humi]